jgi:hypothetical protein
LRRQHCEHTVSDIDEIRAKLRDGQSTAAPSTGGWFGLWVLVTCVVGFGAVFFGPRILGLGSYSAGDQTSSGAQAPSGAQGSAKASSDAQKSSGGQNSSGGQTFSGVQTSLNEFKSTESTPSFLRLGEELPKPPARGVVANYDGKSAAEIGKIADQVCFNRAQTREPYWGTTPRLTTQNLLNFRPEHMGHFNELLRCLLTEGTRRYCVGSERRMITAEIAMYFRGIAFRNQAAKAHFDENRPRMHAERMFEQVQRDHFGAPDKATQLQRAVVDVDQAVVTAIEYRLRDGLLTKANRDEIAAAAPPAIRERLARIEPPKSSCPDEPWWAVWR